MWEIRREVERKGKWLDEWWEWKERVKEFKLDVIWT